MANSKFNIITNWDVMEEQIIFYRTHLDIAVEEMFAPIKLTRDQHVIMREFGNCKDTSLCCSRGWGKTWLAIVGSFALGVLYPGSNILVVSATAQQATLALGKLKQLVEQNKNLANEISATNARSLVQVQKDISKCTLKNGSVIESGAIDSLRGRRAKIVIIDESRDIDQAKLDAIVSPIKNETRYNARTFNFKDFPSKTITLSSACEKNNPYFEAYMKTVKAMSSGNKQYCAVALDYNAAVSNGITGMDYFMEEKEKMAELTFQMEYGAKFISSSSNSAFPFELVQKCRTLEKVELCQPKNSTSYYHIALDIATSEATDADKSVVTVVKYRERSDGSFAKKLVYIKSYHGEKLDKLAEEIRKLFHVQFPNAAKISFDRRGLGDSFDRFFDKEWIDPVSGKEYPPLVLDNQLNINSSALPALHSFTAVQSLNQRIYTNLRVNLEKGMLELPISSRVNRAKQAEITDPSKLMGKEEVSIYDETDALQYEMGNIVAKVGVSGNILYDTPRASMHKDRYSSLAMNIDFISELEKENMKKYRHGDVCVGVVSEFGAMPNKRF